MKNHEAIMRTEVFAKVGDETILVSVQALLDSYERVCASKKRISGHIVFDDITEVHGNEACTGSYIDKNGCIIYLEKGRFHRVGGPAIKYANGSEFWFEDNWRHRVDGPAVIVFDKQFKATERYYIKGVEYSLEDWKAILKK